MTIDLLVRYKALVYMKGVLAFVLFSQQFASK
jgi:hypothetical protein